MKKTLFFLLLLSSNAYSQAILAVAGSKAVSGSSGGGSVTAKFNFNQTAQSVSGYADVSGNPHTAIRTATQNGISISTRGTTYWIATASSTTSQNGGEATANPTFLHPADATASYMFSEDISVTDGEEQLEVSGLTPNAFYTVKFYGSRENSVVAEANRNTRYIVKDKNGRTVSADFDVKGNTTNEQVFINVQADANGKIWLGGYGPNNVTNSRFAYFNVITIISE